MPDAWLTVAEASDFKATSSYDETLDFLRRVDAASASIQLGFFGRSGAGRLLPLVIVSSDGAFTPEAATATGKPILLLQSCIHAGEVDGKDASHDDPPRHGPGTAAELAGAHDRALRSDLQRRRSRTGVDPTTGQTRTGRWRAWASGPRPTGINLNRDHPASRDGGDAMASSTSSTAGAHTSTWTTTSPTVPITAGC